MKKLLFTGLLATTASLNAHAYQFEIGGALITGSTDNNADLSGMALGGTYYFSEVSSDGGPLAEAAFLQKASDISLSFATVENDVTDTDFEVTSISGRYVFESTWLIELALDQNDDGGADTDDFSFLFGKYLSDTSEIDFVIGQQEELVGDDILIIGVDYKNLLDMEGDGSLVLEVGFDFLEGDNSDTLLEVDAAWYLNNKLGMHVGTAISDGDTGDGVDLSLAASYFVTDSVELRAEYETINFEPEPLNTERNTKLISLSVAARF